jgi:uncharacterized membrane protein YecN with MAPEG domain
MPYHVEFSIDISAIYIAAAGIFLVFLALDVVRARWKYQGGFGEGFNEKGGEKGIESGIARGIENNEDPLSRRRRVHANAAEYFSVALLLLVAVENIVAIDWVVHALGVLLLASRLIHAAGLRGMAGESLPRTLGTVGTITMVSVSAILVLVNSF